jgi:aryl-alcohol dehydrogenase-like predicted oxidoreductase
MFTVIGPEFKNDCYDTANKYHVGERNVVIGDSLRYYENFRHVSGP